MKRGFEAEVVEDDLVLLVHDRRKVEGGSVRTIDTL